MLAVGIYIRVPRWWTVGGFCSAISARSAAAISSTVRLSRVVPLVECELDYVHSQVVDFVPDNIGLARDSRLEGKITWTLEFSGSWLKFCWRVVMSRFWK